MSQIRIRRGKLRPARVAKYAFLVLASFLSAFPFYWMLVSATNSNQAIMEMRMFPGANLIENWKTLTAGYALGTAFLNSLRNATVTTVCALFISSLAGYALARIKGRFFNISYQYVVTLMVVPFISCLLMLVRLSTRLSLYNTIWGCILIPTAWHVPFCTFLSTGFLTSFPVDPAEAPSICGFSTLRT